MTVTLTAASSVQRLAWVDSLRWLKFLFQAKSDLSSSGRGLGVLCTSKTGGLMGDTGDGCLGPGHYHCVRSLGKGISKDLNCEECCWLQPEQTNVHHPLAESV